MLKSLFKQRAHIDHDQELAISFVQIGNDREASEFLKFLDDELENTGAKFDIVDTVSIDDIEDENLTLKEVLIKAMTD